MSTSAMQYDETLSHQEYFALESDQQQKYEYLAGEVFAMSGGSTRHARIATNTIISLAKCLSNPNCSIYNSDATLFVDEVDGFFHPDIMMLCEDSEEQEKFVKCPQLIIEVLSPSTQDYDHGQKFSFYRQIDCLENYIMLHQDKILAEVYQRDNNRWILQDISGIKSSITLANGLKLKLADLYQQVTFD